MRFNLLKTAAILLVAVVSAIGQTPGDHKVEETPKSPVSYGIVVDNSGSMRLRLERVIQMVLRIIEAHGPEDEAFLVTFVDSEKIHVRQEMTDDEEEFRYAINEMFIEGGKTAIIDALRLSAGYLIENARSEPSRLRRLILITDGDERESRTKLADLLIQLKDAKIAVLVIGVAEQRVEPKLIDRLVKETGGRKYLPRTQAEMDSTVTAVVADLRSEL